MIHTAPVHEIERLLGTFSVKSLKAQWADTTTKAELARTAAENADRAAIVSFVEDYFSCCKQHVYVCDRPAQLTAGADLPAAIGPLTRLTAGATTALYCGRVTFSVALFDPVEQEEISFLWPVQIAFESAHVVIKVVVIEKDALSYFNRKGAVISRSLEEQDLVARVRQALGLVSVDLEAGVKALWANGYMDANKAKSKTEHGALAQNMDKDYLVKKDEPKIYQQLVDAPLLHTMFKISEEADTSVDRFSVNPSEGYLSFSTYTDAPGDTHGVLRKILQHNS